MSFAFGFGGDDIEHESDNDELAQQVESCVIDDVPIINPKEHTLQELLSSLPSQISYNLLPIVAHQRNGNGTNSEVVVPRRSVFDIRTQLMAEANPDENDNEALLAGLERGDLTSGFYEGGFKTWECSLDLASLVSDLRIEDRLHIVELGAGSSIPSLVAINIALAKSDHVPIHFTLCDYNEDVLRLGTAPNIFLAAERTPRNNPQFDVQDDLDVEDIDEEKVRECLSFLDNNKLSFDFVSGGWGDDFVRLIQSSQPNSQAIPQDMLILASETIYSPKSTGLFVNTLMHLLRQDPAHRRAWIAAKKVYFGVGGSVDDFVGHVVKQNGIVRTLLDVQGAGVGRVVLEITVGM